MNYAEAIAVFLKAIRSHHIKNDYTPFNISNRIKQWYILINPDRTNEFERKKTVRIVNTGCRERDFAVEVAGSTSSHKFPAFIILK